MYETDLAADCVAGLRAALPAETEVEVRNEAWRPGAPFTDGWLQMFGPWGRIEVPFEVRPRINNAAVALMERRFQEIQGPERTGLPAWILLTEYVNPEEARRLRKGGIAFADTCGNAHVWGEALYVWVTGNRPKTRRMRTPGLTRPAAARVLFVLLQEPGRAREPYRELAALANVAPDTVHRVFNDLQKKGFLRTWGTRERELLRVPELVELWTLGYGDALRPKLRPKPCHWVDGGEMADLLDMLPADTTTPGHSWAAKQQPPCSPTRFGRRKPPYTFLTRTNVPS